MFSSDSIDSAVLGHLLAQHHDLHARLLALRAAFTAAEVPGATACGELRGHLCGLRERLVDHFAQEERGGFLEDSIARLPRLAAAVRGVMAEHPQLLAELDALLECVPITDIRDSDWSEARRRFTGFAEHLLAHERNEHAVVQQGYNEDLGFRG